MNLPKVICDYLNTNTPSISWRAYRIFLTGSDPAAAVSKRHTKIVTIGFHPDHITINSFGQNKTIIQYYDPELPEHILAEVQSRHRAFLARKEFKAEFITINHIALRRKNLQYLADADGLYDPSGGEYDYATLIDRLIEDRCRSYADWRANQRCPHHRS